MIRCGDEIIRENSCSFVAAFLLIPESQLTITEGRSRLRAWQLSSLPAPRKSSESGHDHNLKVVLPAVSSDIPHLRDGGDFHPRVSFHWTD
jgi:hypothetical protein